MGVGDRVFEARWSELGQEEKWETVIGKTESQWEQVNGKRLENRWEWVRRVCPILRRKRMISTRHFGCCEDGHGTGEFFSWANLLPVAIWSRQKESFPIIVIRDGL